MATLYGSAAGDVLQGSYGADILSGGPRLSPEQDRGGDTLDAGRSADLLFGWGGDDSLTGDAGDDRLLGGTGRDTLSGGGGDDTILPAASPLLAPEGNVIDGGHGIDWLSYETEPLEPVIINLAGGFSYDRVSGIENLRGGNGHDALTGNGRANRLEGLGSADALSGGARSDTLVGGDEPGLGDVLDGGDGRDSILGGQGFDLLLGGAQRDVLDGGETGDQLEGGLGSDTLIGGGGADTLAGGRGHDVFRYAGPAEGGDVIRDYMGRKDQVEISAAGFGDGLTAGQDLVGTGRYAANAGGHATAAIGQFLFDTAVLALSWDPDGTGAAAPVLLFHLEEARHWSGAELTVVA